MLQNPPPLLVTGSWGEWTLPLLSLEALWLEQEGYKEPSWLEVSTCQTGELRFACPAGSLLQFDLDWWMLSCTPSQHAVTKYLLQCLPCSWGRKPWQNCDGGLRKSENLTFYRQNSLLQYFVFCYCPICPTSLLTFFQTAWWAKHTHAVVCICLFPVHFEMCKTHSRSQWSSSLAVCGGKALLEWFWLLLLLANCMGEIMTWPTFAAWELLQCATNLPHGCCWPAACCVCVFCALH